ncbi:LysR family transcriptional regulator [Xanthobacter sp. ZOL 2024]
MISPQRATSVDLVTLRAFLAVVEAGGISAAARRSGVAKSVFSERVTALEKALGVTLFNRGQRLSLTERGRVLAEGARPLLGSLDDLFQVVTINPEELGGRIKITTSAGLGVRYLGAIITDYLAEHPNVEAEITYDDRFVDIAAENYDVALRIGQMRDSDLVGRRLCAIRRLICASPSYIENHGRPRTVGELGHHRGIAYSLLQSTQDWRFQSDSGKLVNAKPPRTVLLANNGEAVRDAVLAGIGIGNLPSFFVADDIAAGRIIALKLDFSIAPVDLWALHSRRREPRPIAETLISWIASRLRDPPFWEANLDTSGPAV